MNKNLKRVALWGISGGCGSADPKWSGCGSADPKSAGCGSSDPQ